MLPVTQVRFELGVGVLPADLHVRAGKVERVVMTQAQAAFLDTLSDVAELATGLNLPAEAIAASGLPVQVVSTGIPAMMVPVRSLSEVQSLDFSRLNTTALNHVCRLLHTEDVMVFTLQTERPQSSVHARNFAPLLGVPEDPATGSASGAMGAYLVHHRAVPIAGPTVRIISEQGAEIGRPSQVFIEVDLRGPDIAAVRVSGQVVLVAEGVVRF